MKKINWKLYNKIHIHPSFETDVEIVAYQRKDQKWDVYVFEPLKTIPELEKNRCDKDHIFIDTIDNESQLSEIYVNKIKKLIGDSYEIIPYYKEQNTRKTCDKIFDHLRKNKCTGMGLHLENKNTWIINIRRKDFEIARKICECNVY